MAPTQSRIRKKRMAIERRRHLRFQVDNPSFVVLDTAPRKLGQLVDICPQGLAFRYLVEPGDQSEGRSLMDLFCSQNDLYLADLPFKPVSARFETSPPYSTIITKIEGVQFEELTEDQQSRLEQFIRQSGALRQD